MQDADGEHPAVVHFSRRAAIKASLLAAADKNPDTVRKMEPYHADYSRLSAREARLALERTLAKVDDTLNEIPQEHSGWLTLDSLLSALQKGLVRF